MKRLVIVIEDAGEPGANGFNVYLGGDKDRIGKVPESELSAAEFWGAKLFGIVTGILNKTGAVRVTEKKET